MREPCCESCPEYGLNPSAAPSPYMGKPSYRIEVKGDLARWVFNGGASVSQWCSAVMFKDQSRELKSLGINLGVDARPPLASKDSANKKGEQCPT
jgi:hypothetical protein